MMDQVVDFVPEGKVNLNQSLCINHFSIPTQSFHRLLFVNLQIVFFAYHLFYLLYSFERKFAVPKGKSLQRRENRYREGKIDAEKKKWLPKRPLSLPKAPLSLPKAPPSLPKAPPSLSKAPLSLPKAPLSLPKAPPSLSKAPLSLPEAPLPLSKASLSLSKASQPVCKQCGSTYMPDTIQIIGGFK